MLFNLNEVNYSMDKCKYRSQKMISKIEKPKYKKKINLAVPKRTNSTQSMRTLQASNRSLALSLEKMRNEFLLAHTHLTKLQNKNSKLREQVFELKHRGVPGKVIQKEVKKICKERLGNVRKKIYILNDLATEFVDTLAELSDICFLGNFPEAASLSQVTSPSYTSTFNRGMDGTCFSSDKNDKINEYEETETNLKLLERSFNREQSSKSSSDERNTVSKGKPSPSIHSSSSFINNRKSQSKLKLHGQSSKQKKPSHNSIRKAKCKKPSQTVSNDSLRKVKLEEKFNMISDEIQSSNVTSDVAKSHFKFGDHHEKNEWIDTQSSVKASGDLGLISTSSVEKACKKGQDFRRRLRPDISLSSSLEELSVLTFEMPSELYKPHKSPNKISKQKKISPLKKSLTHKNNLNNFVKAVVNKVDRFTANETDFVNSHDQSLETSVNNTTYITTIQRCFPYNTEKSCLKPENNSQYLTDEEIDMIEHDRLSPEVLSFGNTSNRDKVKTDLFKVCDILNTKQKEHNECQAEGKGFFDGLKQITNSDHVLYECQTLIESTGDCKFSPITCRKTRLKPKKEKACKGVSLLRGNLQSGFNFKEDSHVVSNTKKRKVNPMVDLSTDQFSLSPPKYSSKNRLRFKNTKITTKENYLTDMGHTNNSNAKIKANLLLSEDLRQEVQFGDIGPVPDLNYQLKPHSYCGTKSVYDSSNICAIEQILSKFKLIQSTKAANFKIVDTVKSVDDSLEMSKSAELTESAADTITMGNKQTDS